MGDWVNLYYGVDEETNINYKSRQGKEKKSLPVVLLVTAKQQTYIVKLTNLVPLQIWIHTLWFVFTLAYEITNNCKKKKIKKN